METHASGKKLAGILKFQKAPVDHLHVNFEDKPSFADVDVVASEILAQYEAGAIDAFHVVYTKFLSSARQKAVAEQVLPLSVPVAAERGAVRDYIFSPDAPTILAGLLPQSVRLHVFQAFLDAAVSEQTARMVAMKSATDNAYEMIKTLTRRYNRSRQSLITTELSEIMGGAAALE
jgi:F-type H+-transporting ATPase subunit gamma